MTGPANRPQADRSRWVTLIGARRNTATPELLSSVPVGTVLGADVEIGNDGSTGHLSLVKVSPGKWAVQQGRGFSAHRLTGARVAVRVRREGAEVAR